MSLPRGAALLKGLWQSFCAVLLAGACTTPILAASQQSYLSPDREMAVTVRTTRQHCADRLAFQRPGAKVIFEKSLAGKDCDHSEAFARGAWTADSRFFVFATSILGGHMPWARPTYFYNRQENRVYDLDKFVGPIDDWFKLEPPDIVVIRRIGKPGEKGEERVVVRLRELVR